MTASDDSSSWSFGAGVPAPSGGAAEPPEAPGRRPWLAPGEVFAGCELLEELGRGGMGVVFRARELRSGRLVAIKVLRARQTRARERFRREGELTAALAHPGIVRVHAGGEEQGLPYLIYELIPGGETLDRAFRGRSERERAALVRDVARAVGHAHRHGVVHRDLKPENVLVDANGAHVADFGLAWARSLDRLTQSGALVGTPAYMAPEQIAPEVGERGPWTDVWALGGILYLALTDRRPFEADGFHALRYRITAGDLRPPRVEAPGVSPELEAVCLKALSVRPEDRYADANELADDLDRALRGDTVLAPSASRFRLGAPARRRVPWALAGLSLVLSVGGALWAGRHLAARARQEQTLRRLVAAGGPLDALEAALADAEGDAALLARGHLLLAAGEAQEPTGWRRRLEHARRAEELWPEYAPRARILAARALLRLGRPGEAARLYETSDGTLAARRAAVRGYLEAGEPEQALRVARACAREDTASREDAVLLLDAFLAAKQDAEAFAWVQGLPPGPTRALLRARLVAASGAGDPGVLLHEALLRWPTDEGLRQALALHRWLREDDPFSALAALGRRTPREDTTRLLQRALQGLLEEPPAVEDLARAPLAWRRTAGRWLLGEARRELALAERDPAPGASSSRGPGTTKARTALAALARLALHDDLEAEGALLDAWISEAELDPDELDERIARARDPTRGRILRAEARRARGDVSGACAELCALPAARLRMIPRGLAALGELALAAGRPRKAVEALRAAQGTPWERPEQAEWLARLLEREGDTNGAAAARKRGNALARPLPPAERFRRLQALRSKEVGKRASLADLLAGYDALLAEDPGFAEASFFRGRLRFMSGARREEGLIECLWAVERDPRLAVSLWKTALVGLRPGGPLAPQDLLAAGTARGRKKLGQLFAICAQVEHSGTREVPADALPQARELLAEDPGSAPAWLWLGFLAVRAGRPALAERALDVAGAAAPRCGLVPFYRLLLAGARGAPPSAAAELLEEAHRLNFWPARTPGWKGERYPELACYRDAGGSLAALFSFGR
ncbi:MAG: serine/threonine protein kinase [Planctomycetota bacterium]|nr:MAG: serine/threonine protein kinase [Planctomycetota bacterium]